MCQVCRRLKDDPALKPRILKSRRENPAQQMLNLGGYGNSKGGIWPLSGLLREATNYIKELLVSGKRAWS